MQAADSHLTEASQRSQALVTSHVELHRGNQLAAQLYARNQRVQTGDEDTPMWTATAPQRIQVAPQLCAKNQRTRAGEETTLTSAPAQRIQVAAQLCARSQRAQAEEESRQLELRQSLR